jgi:3-methyladenine DNA glycosylase AlkD
MNQLSNIKTLLQQYAQVPKEKQSYFFKTGPGHYAEHDKFLGITIPNLRKIAKSNKNLAHEDIETLIKSPYNEERLMALFILVSQLSQVNNWNLVDASAPFIVGAHLHQKNKEQLLTLAQSQSLWGKRIAIVSTLYFIRNNDLEWTFKIAKLLLDDKHDLIHKAVGWMLREAGKKDQNQLIDFLEQYAGQMPRTMLRYSVERFPEQQRKIYLNKPRIFNEK